MCFSLKYYDFFELCQFRCCSAGVLPAIWRSKRENGVHTLTPRKNRERQESRIYFKKTQYLMNILYLNRYSWNLDNNRDKAVRVLSVFKSWTGLLLKLLFFAQSYKSLFRLIFPSLQVLFFFFFTAVETAAELLSSMYPSTLWNNYKCAVSVICCLYYLLPFFYHTNKNSSNY